MLCHGMNMMTHTVVLDATCDRGGIISVKSGSLANTSEKQSCSYIRETRKACQSTGKMVP